MNSIVISLETGIPQTALSKDAIVQVDGVDYAGKIILVMTHEKLAEESIVILKGSGLETVTP